jgi:ribosomal protein S18 acetylase RimI-like enzyme
MLRVRTVRNLDEFAGAPGDPDNYADTVGSLWESGESKPGWCFLLEDGGEQLGRIGFRVAPTTSDPRWLGSLPPEELFAFGLHLPWEGDYLGKGRRMLSESVSVIVGEVPDMLEVRINNEVHPHAPARCRLMETCGLGLVQEKQGFSWVDDGTPIKVGGRLQFRSIEDVGKDSYRSVMAPCGEGTLDRNDRYYWEGCGPHSWAEQMTAYFEEEDARMWLVAHRAGSAVGYVAVASDDDWGSTIVHIGVIPEQRGNGYIHDLIAAGTAAAQKAGIQMMLSDVDVLNQPMVNAMRRAGHRDDHRPWHIWVYRADTNQIAE